MTAVEWFAEKIGHNSLISLVEYNELIEQALEMEKEQIMDAWNDGNNRFSGIGDAETFYETFKSE